MSLDLPRGARCFVDANILFYHFVDHPPFATEVTTWMRRVALGDIVAFTSLQVIADALHRVMLSEVQMLYSPPKALAYVHRHPQVIATLSAYPAAVKAASSLSLRVLNADASLLLQLSAIAQTQHLMTNDALIVATMQRNQIEHLVTNDSDFDKVPGVTVWKPR